MSNQSLKTSLTHILMKLISIVVGSCENKKRRYRSLNFDPIRILTATLMPVTLLLIKLEKQSI